MIRHVSMVVFITIALVGCRAPVTPRKPTADPTRPQFKGKTVQSVQFGKARIAVGMTKQEVLTQIELSRAQYNPLKSETDSQIYVSQPSQETILSDRWFLTCPTRNSHLLGGGGGIMLRLTYTNEKVAEIEQIPWMGA